MAVLPLLRVLAVDMSSSIQVCGVVSSSMEVVHTRTFLRNRRDPASFLVDLLTLLASEKTTGRMIIDLSQGGFGLAVVTESTDLAPLP